MRVLSLVVLSAILLAFTAAPDRGPASASTVARGPLLMPETQPTTPAKKPADAKVPSVDAEIKALNLRPMNVNTAMGRLKTAKTEDKLKGWATNGAATELSEARKTGVMLAGMTKVVEWKKNKKRSKDAKAYDQITTDLESAARKLAEAAGKKDSDEVKAASDEISRSCSSCHSQFK